MQPFRRSRLVTKWMAGKLRDDQEKWTQFARFFSAVRDPITHKYPSIPIDVKTTWNATVGAQDSAIAQLNRQADALMVTYYRMDEALQVSQPLQVSDDFARLAKIADGKPVFLLETGFPSGMANGSS